MFWRILNVHTSPRMVCCAYMETEFDASGCQPASSLTRLCLFYSWTCYFVPYLIRLKFEIVVAYSGHETKFGQDSCSEGSYQQCKMVSGNHALWTQ